MWVGQRCISCVVISQNLKDSLQLPNVALLSGQQMTICVEVSGVAYKTYQNNVSNMSSCQYEKLVNKCIRTSIARTLIARSPWLARTIIMVPKGHFMHNLSWKAGTTLG